MSYLRAFEVKHASQDNSPVVILSHPQMGENIGATARVMSNFGLRELRVIAPRDGWPNDKAYRMAANGDFILDRAKIFPDLASAVADINMLYGTASADRFMVKDTIAPWQLKRHMGRVGFLFGCERTGLSNDDLSLCDAIIKIPTSELNPSLNLAQAVCVIAYEYSKRELDAVALVALEEQLAPKGDVTHMLNFLQKTLERRHFFKSPEMQPVMMRNINNIFMRIGLTEQDVRTLYGIFKILAE